MKLFNIILSLIIISASVFLCEQIISNSLSNQKNKNDYAELNHVKYGLLSIDAWVLQINAILVDEINKMHLSKANERVLRKHVKTLLNTLIDKVDQRIREENSGTAGGRFKQSLINTFVDLEDIKKGIPEYTDAVMQEMTKSKSRRQIKAMLNKQLEQYSKQTFDTQDRSQLNRILISTDSKNVETARIKLDKEISAKDRLIYGESMLLILLAIIPFALFGFSKKPLAPSLYIHLVLALMLLLLAGITTPMIDMEATISRINFVLMGHTINFENQVLYFQSKSILDMFWIMITHQDFLMKLVGVLLITFSIIFPLLKLASSLGYYYNYHHARNNPVIKFFVFKSGKWSMADVMVISIFMAYIGFNGIITSQLGKLSSATQELVVLTTNGTSLLPGVYLFMSFALLALFLSGFLTRKPLVLENENA